MILNHRTLPDKAYLSFEGPIDELVSVEPAFGFSPVPVELSEKEGKFILPSATMNVVRNATLLGEIGAGHTPDGDVMLDCGFSGRFDTFESNRDYYAKALKAKNARPVSIATGYSMVGVWCMNYFHWHTEFLAGLQGVLSIYEGSPVLIHPNAPRFVVESLKYFGINYSVTPSVHTKVTELLVPTTRRWKGRTSPSALKWIKDEAKKRSKREPSRSIYISRRKAQERRILNEPALFRELKKLGFRRYYVEDMTYAEQVALFMNADHIIAPHGAGLTNVVFSDYEPTVLEIFGDYINPCFYTMFSSMGLPYGFVLGSGIGGDIEVDVDLVMQTHMELRKIGAKQ